MKKIVGIVAGIVILVAVVFGILYSTGKLGSLNTSAPSNDALVTYYDDYLTQIIDNKDADIYNNLLDEKLRKRFTEEQISQMFAYLRAMGEVKEYNKKDVKVEEIKEDNRTIYVVSSKVVYENSPQLVKIKLVKSGNDLKITAFSFTNEI